MNWVTSDPHLHAHGCGGAVTDDAIRSLAISQRLQGTREIMLIHHTECGMASFSDGDFKDAIQRETGIRPPFCPR